MPTILPISELKNYSDVLEEVDAKKAVYLTRNGRGGYVITTQEDYDRQQAMLKMFAFLREGEESAAEGWLDFRAVRDDILG